MYAGLVRFGSLVRQCEHMLCWDRQVLVRWVGQTERQIPDTPDCMFTAMDATSKINGTKPPSLQCQCAEGNSITDPHQGNHILASLFLHPPPLSKQGWCAIYASSLMHPNSQYPRMLHVPFTVKQRLGGRC